MTAHLVHARKFVVVIIKAVAPIRRPAALENRHQAATLNIPGNRPMGRFQEGTGEVEIRNQVAVDAARSGDAGPADDQWSAQRLLKNPPLIEPTMFTEVETLVG